MWPVFLHPSPSGLQSPIKQTQMDKNASMGAAICNREGVEWSLGREQSPKSCINTC